LTIVWHVGHGHFEATPAETLSKWSYYAISARIRQWDMSGLVEWRSSSDSAALFGISNCLTVDDRCQLQVACCWLLVASLQVASCPLSATFFTGSEALCFVARCSGSFQLEPYVRGSPGNPFLGKGALMPPP